MKSAQNQLDPILIEIGDFGKYQIFTTTLLMFAAVISYFSILIYVFETVPVNHRCLIEGCDYNSSDYNPIWLKNAVPFKKNKPAKCLQFQKQNSSCNRWDFNRSVIENCNKFVYETSEKSIVQDFDLHCDENLKTKIAFVGTFNGIGKFIGLPISGFFSDKLGRKKLLVYTSVIVGLLGVIRSFSTSYAFFLLLETADACFSTGVYASVYVLCTELVGPQKRTLITTLQFICFSLGGVILGCVAWLVQSWKLLLQILYPLNILLVLYIWLIPESLRWLLVNNKYEEARIILRNIAKTNKKKLPEDKISNLSIDDAQEFDNVYTALKKTFKSKILIVRCLICSFCWVSCIFVYYGLSVSVTTLSNNNYLDFVLTSAIEIPSYLVAHFIVDKLGRKIILFVSYFLTCVSCVAIVVLPLDLYVVHLLLYLISKCGISIVLYVIYMATNELFPTAIRQTLLSICSMFGRIGNILVPQLILLEEIWFNLPLVIFAISTGISGFLILFLPETKNTALPDTIEEAENIGKVRK